MDLDELRFKIDELCKANPAEAHALANRIRHRLNAQADMDKYYGVDAMIQSALEGLSQSELAKIREQLQSQGESPEEIERLVDEMSRPGFSARQRFDGLAIEDLLSLVEAVLAAGQDWSRWTVERRADGALVVTLDDVDEGESVS